VNRNLLYEVFLKPLFFRLNPETAHELSKSLLELSSRMPLFMPLIEAFTTYRSPKLESKVAGICFPNPVGMAAGFDKTGELYPFLSRMGFGYVEVGTVTGEGQEGNPSPRVFRYPEQEAIINRMGFNNPGAEKIALTLSMQKKSIPRGINAGKTKVIPFENAAKDYAKSFHILADYGDYGVINISSPNTPGLRRLQSRKEFQKLYLDIQRELGGGFPFPIFVKFAPDLSEKELLENLEECMRLNVSGVILTNTTVDKSALGIENPEEGGLSGKPLRERANQFTRIARRFLQGKIPIIGVGGIDSGESALQRIRSGANLIQIYTGYIYKGPFLPYEINKYLDGYLARNQKSSIAEIVGEDV